MASIVAVSSKTTRRIAEPSLEPHTAARGEPTEPDPREEPSPNGPLAIDTGEIHVRRIFGPAGPLGQTWLAATARSRVRFSVIARTDGVGYRHAVARTSRDGAQAYLRACAAFCTGGAGYRTGGGRCIGASCNV